MPELTKALKNGDICVLKDDKDSPLRDISDQEENKSRINATLKKELGFLSQLYEIQKKGFVESRNKGRKLQRVGLDLSPSDICFCSLNSKIS